MLRNIRILCPSFATPVINLSQGEAELLVGGETLLLKEGTTQGDPMAMVIYALSTLPLIDSVKRGLTQTWFADDACGGSRLETIHSWWLRLVSEGPKYMDTSLILQKSGCWSRISIKKESKNFSATGRCQHHLCWSAASRFSNQEIYLSGGIYLKTGVRVGTNFEEAVKDCRDTPPSRLHSMVGEQVGLSGQGLRRYRQPVFSS